MATESDLRDLLRGPDPEGRGDIDLDAVLSRSRRRRRPRVIVAQALGSVAIVGVLGTAVYVAGPLAQPGVMMSTEDSGAGAGDESATAPLADDGVLKWMPDACGTPVTDQPSTPGVTLEMTIVTTFEPAGRMPVTVTLRNDGPDPIVGTTSASPSVSSARAGTVVWHSSATQDATARVVNLAPGESETFETYVDGVICSTEDDLLVDDPQHELPPAPPGDYELRAVVVLTTDAGATLVAASAPLPLEIVG